MTDSGLRPWEVYLQACIQYNVSGPEDIARLSCSSNPAGWRYGRQGERDYFNARPDLQIFVSVAFFRFHSCLADSYVVILVPESHEF